MLSKCRLLNPVRLFSTSISRSLTPDGHRLVLGIESSCDDSCASLVSAPEQYFRGVFQGAKVHNSVVLKQDHSLTKGIEPLNAANIHSANIPLAIKQSLHDGYQSGILKDDSDPVEIDAIAVTRGPGMAASLSQGLSNAKLLSALWNKPLIYVHHMIAHTLTPYLIKIDNPIRMPFLVLLLSGGHTQMVLCKSQKDFKILASTSDDSIGDAFDKVARLLRIDFDWSKTSPGAALESFAQEQGSLMIKLPIPFRNKLEFSFSGLKSAIQRLVASAVSEQDRRALAYAFQRAAFDQILNKIEMAFRGDLLHEAGGITDLVISGGVASNQYLRRSTRNTLDSISQKSVRTHFPPISLCTDNAAMIAHAGLVTWDITHDLTAIPKAKWSVEDI